jgi:uncharacterized protein YdaU (DUF1376 family)
MGKDPAFMLYSQDFLVGVSDLTMEERGQYITMLCLQHQKGRLSERTISLSVPNVSEYVLAKFDIDENGNYYNKRLESEIIKRESYAQSRRENGKKKWEKQKQENAYANDNECICKDYANAPKMHSRNINININENINDNDNEIINKVIDYLNNKCKTRYRANTNDVKKHLLARIREGYTYEDAYSMYNETDSLILNNLENKKEAKTFDLESLLSPFLLNHHYDLL